MGLCSCHRPNLIARGSWRCRLPLALTTWPLFPRLGVEAPFGSFSTSLSFRTRSRVAGRSLRTYLSHPLNFFHPLHHTWTRSRREGFYLAWTRSTARRSLTRLNSLDGEKVFNSCLYIAPRGYIFSPLEALRTFLSLVPLHCPRGYIFSPLEALRTFYWCLYIAPEATSSLPWKHWGLLLVPLHCSRGYIFSPLEALRTFTLSRLHSPTTRRSFNWCLQSPKNEKLF